MSDWPTIPVPAMAVCPECRSCVPNTNQDKALHRDWHRTKEAR